MSFAPNGLRAIVLALALTGCANGPASLDTAAPARLSGGDRQAMRPGLRRPHRRECAGYRRAAAGRAGSVRRQGAGDGRARLRRSSARTAHPVPRRRRSLAHLGVIRTADGLRLKHDHRHEDGNDDVLTMYGGDTNAVGSAQRQAFPVDAESIALFEREGSQASVTNTWAMEIEPGARFVYELSRPGGRLFRVEFDLTAPVAAPLPPWGSTDPG